MDDIRVVTIYRDTWAGDYAYRVPSIAIYRDTVEPLLYDHLQNHIGVVV